MPYSEPTERESKTSGDTVQGPRSVLTKTLVTSSHGARETDVRKFLRFFSMVINTVMPVHYWARLKDQYCTRLNLDVRDMPW